MRFPAGAGPQTPLMQRVAGLGTVVPLTDAAKTTTRNGLTMLSRLSAAIGFPIRANDLDRGQLPLAAPLGESLVDDVLHASATVRTMLLAEVPFAGAGEHTDLTEQHHTAFSPVVTRLRARNAATEIGLALLAGFRVHGTEEKDQP
jgi:hypothetical protein